MRKVVPSWGRGKAALKKRPRLTFFQNYRRLDGCTGKWLTIKTNVCPVWGIKARAAWRAKEKGE